jgi:hypothetical protein
MNDKALDSDLDVGDGSPAGSDSAQGDKQSLGTQGDLLKRLEKLEKELEVTRRTAQGDKDRAVRKLSEELESYKPVLERVKKLTKMSDEDAAALERELEYDELKRRVFGNNAPRTDVDTSSAKVSAPLADTIAEVVNGFGLKLDEPDVAEVIAQGGNLGTITTALLRVVDVRKSRPKPNPAAVAMPTGEGAPSGKLSQSDVDARIAELAKLQRFPTRNAERIKQLEKELGW